MQVAPAMTKEWLIGACRKNDETQLLLFFKLINHSLLFINFFADITEMRKLGPRISQHLKSCVSRRAVTDSRGHGYNYLQKTTDSEAPVKPAAVRQLKQPVEITDDTPGLFFSSLSLPSLSCKPTLLFEGQMESERDLYLHLTSSNRPGAGVGGGDSSNVGGDGGVWGVVH